jgi:hypothetical protein
MRILAALLLCSLVLTASAQDSGRQEVAFQMTPNALRATLLSGEQISVPEAYQEQKVRSIPLAFGLSAVLPGAGQVYNKQYVKALHWPLKRLP